MTKEKISGQLDRLSFEITELKDLIANAKQSLRISEDTLAGIRESLAGVPQDAKLESNSVEKLAASDDRATAVNEQGETTAERKT